LDWMLPGMDGIEVLKALRKTQVFTPVLLLTARDAKEDVVEGLENGADDYLTKPFDVNILLARIRSLMRSRAWLKPRDSQSIAYFDQCEIDFKTLDAKVRGQSCRLSHKEAMIMKLFWEKRQEVVSREELLQKVWGIEEYIQSRTVDNHIVQLRKIFERNPKKPLLILSIHGEGYKFVGSEESPLPPSKTQ
jgi:DNA-binding response OmpR family regulator